MAWTDSPNYRTIDIDLANGLGLHMILIWGRVALVQGVPAALSYNSMLTILCTLLLVLYYCYVFFIKHKRVPKINQGSIFVAFFVLITLLFTVIIWPNNIQYMDPFGNTLFYEICPFVILGLMTDISNLYDPMVRASRILVLLCAISGFSIAIIGHTTVSSWSSYSMPLSYATLYAVMWLLSDFFKVRRFSSLVLLLIGVLILIVFGSRNTLLSVVAYVLVSVLTNKGIKKQLKYLVLICSVVLVFFWRGILTVVNNWVRSTGISSRTLDLFLSQQYFADSRSTIHQNIFQVLNGHPFGVGIAGDVAQTKEFAHGLFVSILCTYGYVIGAFVIVVIMSLLLMAYRKSFGLSREILMIYILTVIPRGFTGGDIWSSDVFWWMIGIALSIIYRKPIEKATCKQNLNAHRLNMQY